MTFEEVLDQAIDLLQRRGRLTYRTLKRQFDLDEEALKDLSVELIKGSDLRWMKTEKSWSGLARRSPQHKIPTVRRMERFKHTFGDRLRAKRDESLEREASLSCELLDRMRELGRPVSYSVS